MKDKILFANYFNNKFNYVPKIIKYFKTLLT